MSDVVVLGDIFVDIIARMESYPPPGGDAQATAKTVQLGGTSLNTAVMLMRLGLDVALIGCVGADPFGDFAVAAMASAGLSAQFIQRDSRFTTAVCYIAVTPDGQRTMLSGAGSNRMVDGRDLHAPEIVGARWLHLNSYSVMSATGHASALEAAAEFRANGRTVSIDIGAAPVRLRPRELAELTARAAIIMPSDDFPFQEPHHQIVRKCGKRGCELVAPDGARVAVPGFVVPVVDTTGAGDSFNAGFITGQVRRLDAADSALLGNACGAAACTVTGAGVALPRAAVVRGLLCDSAPPGWEAAAARVIDALSPWPE